MVSEGFAVRISNASKRAGVLPDGETQLYLHVRSLKQHQDLHPALQRLPSSAPDEFSRHFSLNSFFGLIWWETTVIQGLSSGGGLVVLGLLPSERVWTRWTGRVSAELGIPADLGAEHSPASTSGSEPGSRNGVFLDYSWSIPGLFLDYSWSSV